MSIHTQSVVAIAALLTFSAFPSAAADRTTRQTVIVSSPAVVELDVRGGAVTPGTGVVIVTPAPLPPVPPNACQRGNSSGVSRC